MSSPLPSLKNQLVSRIKTEGVLVDFTQKLDQAIKNDKMYEVILHLVQLGEYFEKVWPKAANLKPDALMEDKDFARSRIPGEVMSIVDKTNINEFQSQPLPENFGMLADAILEPLNELSQDLAESAESAREIGHNNARSEHLYQKGVVDNIMIGYAAYTALLGSKRSKNTLVAVRFELVESDLGVGDGKMRLVLGDDKSISEEHQQRTDDARDFIVDDLIPKSPDRRWIDNRISTDTKFIELTTNANEKPYEQAQLIIGLKKLKTASDSYYASPDKLRYSQICVQAVNKIAVQHPTLEKIAHFFRDAIQRFSDAWNHRNKSISIDDTCPAWCQQRSRDGTSDDDIHPSKKAKTNPGLRLQ